MMSRHVNHDRADSAGRADTQSVSSASVIYLVNNIICLHFWNIFQHMLLHFHFLVNFNWFGL